MRGTAHACFRMLASIRQVVLQRRLGDVIDELQARLLGRLVAHAPLVLLGRHFSAPARAARLTAIERAFPEAPPEPQRSTTHFGVLGGVHGCE